ncbi:putative MFS family arabinose efflux permease [Sphingobium xenophagum]|uniref:MFS family arabinose efflux permease n=1 Tax=Sphingobium xenophagum TaxID=121428 RepID=A0ABU1X583_SPHXE|nr:MFS transporter [Sphingobium xenophagum]MDR7156735.1 putative MFS family arabinose efflux permease [Sphingobium xenophagum]
MNSAPIGLATPQTTSTAKLRRTMLVMLGLVSMFNYIDRTVLSVLQEPIKQELGLSDGQLGLLTGLAFALFYATLSLPIARLADRFNRRNIIAASLATWSGMTALSGLATGFGSLVAFRIGVALGEAGSVPASHSIIADYYPPEKRVTALALWGLALPAGIMLGYASGGWIAAALGWRLAFGVIGIAGLALAPLVLFLVKEPVRTGSAGPNQAEPPPPFGEAIRFLWRLRTYRYMLIGTTLHAFAQYAMMSWSAPFYMRVHHMPLADVASWLAIMNGLGGGIGIYLGGRLSDAAGSRNPAGRVWVSAVAMVLMVPAAMVQFLIPSLAASLAFGFIATMLMFFYYGPIIGVPQSIVPPRIRALTSAVTLLIFNLFGLGLGPAVTGFLSDYLAAGGLPDTSLRYALATVVLFSLAGAGSIAWASRYYRAELKNH